MSTQTSPRRLISWSGLGIGIVIAVILGVGLAYGLNNFAMEAKASPPTPRPASAPPPAPPKIEYLGAATMQGATATLVSDPKQKAELASDDAMIVWLKVTPANPPQNANAPQAGSGQRQGPAAAGGGGAGRGRRMRLPIRVKDPQGRIYSAVPERKEDNLVALHLKKGYDKKPASLTIEQVSQDEVIDSWEIKDVPAPKLVLADGVLKGPVIGEIQLHEGRLPGQVVSRLHLTMPLSKNQGVYLEPIAASYIQIDNSRQATGVMVKPGVSPFDGPINFPNAGMARRVAFDMTPYEGVDKVETVTFHTAKIASRFGQPTFVVDKDEVVTTPSGLKITLVQQDKGPHREPRHIKPEVTVEVSCGTSSMKADDTGIAPRIVAELVNPPLAEFGLGQVNLSFVPKPYPEGLTIFDLPSPSPVTAKPGTIAFGPIKALTLRITVTRAKVGPTKRVVLPVNPKVLPALPESGGGGRPMSATPVIN